MPGALEARLPKPSELEAGAQQTRTTEPVKDLSIEGVTESGL